MFMPLSLLFKDQASIYRVKNKGKKRVSNIPSQPLKIGAYQNNFPDWKGD